MLASALDYAFDPALIASTPASPRDHARLMLVDRSAGTIAHHRVHDLPQFLGENDTLITNTTSVLRARLLLIRPASGTLSRIETEGLLQDPLPDGTWRALIRRASKFRAGERLTLQDSRGIESNDAIELLARDDDAWIVRLHSAFDAATALEHSGFTPIPPYILKARRDRAITVDDTVDRAEYETVYADPSERHSVAAPTAGLHFTPELLQVLARRGVQRADVLLHVGAGTFKPVEATTLEEHHMHSERIEIPASTIQTLQHGDGARRRCVAVGTTAVRAIESLPASWTAADGAYRSNTQLLIQPGFGFRYTNALLTNFHLPRSTLLALVGAFMGMELLHEAYRVAVQERYRFYSYGDAMLVV